MGSLILESRLLYEAVRWAGAAYLVWLAWDGWREAQEEADAGDLPDRAMTYFRRGFVTNLLNPKAALFFVTVMPGFVDPSRPAAIQTVLLVTVYVVAATLIHAAIVVMASSLQPFFGRPRLRRGAALVFAIALVAVAIWLLLKTG